MIEKEKIALASEYFNKAYKIHLDGQIEDAIKAYKISIDIFPSAKAHTYLGWAYSLQGKYLQAIDECKRAIELDPNFGNPYNDIGSYLINMNQHDEAIYWLEKAMDAPEYEPRQFPFYNLGRIYEKKGDWFTALQYYNDALQIDPEYESAKSSVLRIISMLN